MNKFLIGIFTILFLLINAQSSFATVYINELNTNTTNDDWVELYADSDTDISGWVIKDSTSVIATIENGKTIGPSGFYSVNVSNRLNVGGDTITLYTKDESVKIDEFPYGDKGGPCAPTKDTTQSVGRENDGGTSLVRFQVSTKDATNDGAPKEPCPTPSPTATPSNTPTPTLGPTNTPVPTSIPTKASTLTPTKVITPTKKPSPTTLVVQKNVNDSESELVLGEAVTVSPTPSSSNSSGSQVKVGARIFLVLGLLFLGIAIITFTREVHMFSKR